ncbi:Alba DNA/RNA-binding protein [Perilla frutescens var. hirtella]|uniref:Alba DNA/RNA-binding protein n=1 Tax=Perilla frutescens var. hirtella TaxID=608512 RepID=A0AAD4J027_PERFH|nr:Alba DNA/RNA-binding protein [Perilla frutescens var. hirtella]
MEEIIEGVNNIAIVGDAQKKNRIQVSNTKKSFFFYVNLAKDLNCVQRYMQQHNEVELSALGMAFLSMLGVD